MRPLLVRTAGLLVGAGATLALTVVPDPTGTGAAPGTAVHVGVVADAALTVEPNARPIDGAAIDVRQPEASGTSIVRNVSPRGVAIRPSIRLLDGPADRGMRVQLTVGTRVVMDGSLAELTEHTADTADATASRLPSAGTAVVRVRVIRGPDAGAWEGRTLRLRLRLSAAGGR